MRFVRHDTGLARGLRTSGKPFGSRNAAGIADCAFCFTLSLGGDGLAVYSVRAKPLVKGVRGVWTPLYRPLED